MERFEVLCAKVPLCKRWPTFSCFQLICPGFERVVPVLPPSLSSFSLSFVFWGKKEKGSDDVMQLR